MKVVIYKSYEKKSTVYYNYGDDYDEVWHNLNTIEEVKEITTEDFEVLTRAINHFNSKANRAYTIGMLEIIEDDEVDSLLSNFKEYEKKELEKAKKMNLEKLEKAKLAKENAEAKKIERLVKKFAKELNLSEEEVRIMLEKK